MTAPHTVTRRPPSPAEQLALVTTLASRLDEAEVVYCHWKSNEHLDAAVRGFTDLDLLVSQAHGAAMDRVLTETGFHRFPAAPQTAYPGIDDYLGFDAETGRLVHVHLHYQLTLGEQLVKSYRLPWEHHVLATRRCDPESGVYCADPHVELVLLLVRAALKLRWRDSVFRGDQAGLRGGARREFDWLVARCDRDHLLATATRLLGPEPAALALHALDSPPSRAELRRLRAAMGAQLDRCRTYGAWEARRRRWLRELRLRLRPRDVTAGRFFPARRTLPHGGRVVAILGCDGSGKSTLVRELSRWLAWKVDVQQIYFGSGDGPMSPFRRAVRGLGRLVRRAAPAAPAAPAGAPVHRAAGPASASRRRRLFRVLLALAVAAEKRRALRRATRARNLAMIAVCDRYPQNQILGFSDGPLLDAWRTADSAWMRAVGRWERRPYDLAAASPPDLIIRLTVSPEVAIGRKPDAARQDLPARIAAIARLQFAAPAQVVELDADRPFDEVLVRAKRAIWEAL